MSRDLIWVNAPSVRDWCHVLVRVCWGSAGRGGFSPVAHGCEVFTPELAAFRGGGAPAECRLGGEACSSNSACLGIR